MTDKQILDMLGLNDRTISISFDEDYQKLLENKIDDYLKKLDEEKKKKDNIDFFKKTYEEHKEKEKYLNTFNDSYVYNKIKNKLIRDGFIYRCPYCLDLSNSYGKAIKKYKNEK